MYSIEKDFFFEAAHRLLPPYEGKCGNLHGHSYKIQIRAKGEKLGPEGFLVDFSALKPLGVWIDENWDHASLLSKKDHALIELLRTSHQRMFLFDDNPTSEVLGYHLYQKAQELLPGFEIEVRVNETCKSRVIVKAL